MTRTLKNNKPGSLDAWLDYLQSLNPEHMELGLSRIKKVFDRLDLSSLSKKTIVEVAGTNGKGSTAVLISQSLINSGLNCGLYTSPHLHRFNERICINGKEISDEALVEALSAVYEASYKEPFIPLTYFEYTTLAAFVCFKNANVQAMVLEIGLGGRLDAVNILDAHIAVITSIGFDHVKILGNTLAKIAYEKAGIIKEHARVVCGTLPDEALTVIKECAQKHQAEFYEENRDFKTVFKSTSFFIEKGRYCDDEITYRLPLPKVPRECAGVALKTLSLLKEQGLEIKHEAVVRAMSSTVLPGRMQRMHQKPDIYFDVAHNLPAAVHLKNELNRHLVAGRRLAVIGMLKDKDIEGVLKTFADEFDMFYLASLHTQRGEKNTRLREALISAGCASAQIKTFDTVKDALESCCQEANSDDEITVCGSFVTVTEAGDCAKDVFKVFLSEIKQ